VPWSGELARVCALVFDPGSDTSWISSACAGGEHQECGHVRVGMRGLLSADRLQSVIVLCECDCHASCPLVDRAPVPLTVWQQLCVCPGGERYRVWKEDAKEPWPGAGEAWEQTRRKTVLRTSARRQAFRAAQGAANGKTRAQVRDIYVAELRARDQETPPEPFLEIDLDLLTGHRLWAMWKMEKLRRTGT
jgi:hypothetical protein